jgi:hypothetical protein
LFRGEGGVQAVAVTSKGAIMGCSHKFSSIAMGLVLGDRPPQALTRSRGGTCFIQAACSWGALERRFRR